MKFEQINIAEKNNINLYWVDVVLPWDDIEWKKYSEELSEKLKK